ncbi:MAG: site-specific recombinase XerD [Mycobacterium sp.]|nr:site-specific recombinase XerD [Mycobacterium sp.]
MYDGGGLIPTANGPRKFRRAASLTSCSVHSHDYAVGQTKGRKVRSVPVPTFVLEELSLQCKEKAPGDLVFSGPAGGYLPHPKSSGGWFAAAVKRAGVQQITPHDLRHSCASLAISAGVNVLALQRMLGHTEGHSGHLCGLFDTDLDAVATTLHANYSRESVRKTRSLGAHESM